VNIDILVTNLGHSINCWRLCGFGFPQGPQILVNDSNKKTELEQEINKNAQLQQILDKTKRELQENQDQ